MSVVMRNEKHSGNRERFSIRKALLLWALASLFAWVLVAYMISKIV
jgi:hypothetical protein